MSSEPPIHQSRPQRDPNTTLLLRTLPRPLPFEFLLDLLWSFLSLGYVLLQHALLLKPLSFESKVFILNKFNSIHQSIDNVSPGFSYSANLPAFWTCNTYFCSNPLSLPFPWSASFFSYPFQPHFCMVDSFFITQTSVQVSPLEKPLPFSDLPAESLLLLVLFPFDPICLKLSFLHTCSLIHCLSSQDCKPYKSLTYCHICST